MRKAARVELLVGTRNGGFIFRSDGRRRRWQFTGPLLAGCEVNHLVRDARTGRLWAALNSPWWGADLQRSGDGGCQWQKAGQGLRFAGQTAPKRERIWCVVPDRESRPKTLWCGAAPGGLFRTDDGGAGELLHAHLPRILSASAHVV